jgi:hypothetical protein
VILRQFSCIGNKTPHCGVDLSTPVGNLERSAFGNCVSALGALFSGRTGKACMVTAASAQCRSGSMRKFGGGNYARIMLVARCAPDHHSVGLLLGSAWPRLVDYIKWYFLER